MRKGYLCIALPVLLILFLFGCAGKKEEFRQPVLFFYPEQVQEDGSINNVISSETREGIDFAGNLPLLLESYLAGPKDPSLYCPFPVHTELIEVILSENRVTLRFDEGFGTLSSLERSIACACIGRTCMEYSGADTVEIFAENTLFDGVESILVTRDNLLTQDNTPITEP